MAATVSSEEAKQVPDSHESGKGTWAKTKDKFEQKQVSEYYDPCQDFANRSIKCLHRNGGDRSMCTDYFQAYRDCKKEWTAQRQAAKRAKKD